MIDNNTIKETIDSYNPEKIRIGVLGSHSALEIASGAKQEGFKTVVVCQNGREKTYARYYRELFDKFIFLDKFSDITNPETVKATNGSKHHFCSKPLLQRLCRLRSD